MAKAHQTKKGGKAKEPITPAKGRKRVAEAPAARSPGPQSPEPAVGESAAEQEAETPATPAAVIL